jgi:hypothetical protein
MVSRGRCTAIPSTFFFPKIEFSMTPTRITPTIAPSDAPTGRLMDDLFVVGKEPSDGLAAEVEDAPVRGGCVL